ncbi:MAG: PLP-dependent aminotransferase family protein [Gemmatimonadota bacterium]
MDLWREALAAIRSGESKSKALAQAIARDIENGALKNGARMPPQRDLGARLGISVQTVTNAYQELERHGLIRCEVGRGSFVSRRKGEQVAVTILDRSERLLVDFSIARIVHTPEHEDQWCRTCSELSACSDQPWMRECRPIAGFEVHRAAGVAWLASLGLKTSPDRLLITNGASHAVFLALASLVRPGDVVLSESLVDHGVIGSAQVLGFTLKGLDIDEYGIQPDHFEDMCANERITALVCTPNFNNPTVALMPDSRRRAIARIADRHGVHVIEDDVYGPLLAHRPAPISSHLPELGLYCTSFTKSVMCGLRTGYLSVPRRLALRVDSILRVNSWMGTPLLAEIATRWIGDGTANRLIEVQRGRLQRRQEMVRSALGPHVRAQHPNALSAWIGIPKQWHIDSLVRELRRRNIAVTAPDPFLVPSINARPAAFRLCVGAEVDDARAASALDTIRGVFEQCPKLNDFI